MPPKGAKVKADKQKAQKMVEDKTFGLKNKKKSKVVQKYVAQVKNNSVTNAMRDAEKAQAEKKAAKIAKMQADEELRALFTAAEANPHAKAKKQNKKDSAKDQAAALKKDESDKQKLMKDYPFIADEMLAQTGMLNDLSPDELDTELSNFMKTGKSEKLTLEQVIELQRAKMRAEGRVGTPVTEASLAQWKCERAEKRRREAEAKVTAELKKKKGGKGLSVLSGKELFAYDKSLFVDDEEADVDEYERTSDAEDSEEEEEATAGTARGPKAKPKGAAAAEDSDSDSDSDSEAATNPLTAKAEAQVATALQESLYLEGDDDLEDLDDLSDEE
mmetsp:Transcript_43888/g.99189  ORF Transcript_43888/g.99189 Transcript_43888/m.99189 type:complete len:331 (+) Transcript_43888:216-1208(+)|eukprot:CAMPEP_0172636740 /NCGR_PEP_ID=MMETSP1068-20121228/205503_1 /TAXON_ID=35684 /ORGANISM="Pseudopedinella elastica, Strain CCMP716" /LENGTH=330 /DNA_ID=CAMNT_0013449235 /DNA_START=112 /DNA_END=1104 /DNA_ORIENTATION=-